MIAVLSTDGGSTNSVYDGSKRSLSSSLSPIISLLSLLCSCGLAAGVVAFHTPIPIHGDRHLNVNHPPFPHRRSTAGSRIRLFDVLPHTILDPPPTTTIPPLGQRDLQKVMHVAERAAFAAGSHARSTAGKIAVWTTKMNEADLVTESDMVCQMIIKKVIREEFPGDGILGEEDVNVGSDASRVALGKALGGESGGEEEEERLLWIVDPIDGTTNFQAGLPIFCTSIGVVSYGNSDGKTNSQPEVLVGVIYNPILEEYTCAVRGRGCYVNGKRFHPTTRYDDNDEDEKYGIPLQKAIVNVGFPISSPATLAASTRAATALATRVRGLRTIACASQAMAWVAQGKLAAYVSWDLNAWDVAAGMVIVEESGGRVKDFNGERAGVETRDMVVTCWEGGGRGLGEELMGVLEENGCLDY